MRAAEFVVEYKTEEYNGLHFTTDIKNGQLIVRALDDWGVNELGRVVFNIGDNDELDPQDLEVDSRYQGQGIAKTMYDYVTTLGYEIHRSWDQTPAGAGFWNKHRGEDVRVWEDAGLSYIGNCTDDDVIEHLFGDPTGFAQAVEEHGDEFVLDDLVVKYDPNTDIHSFYYKQGALEEGWKDWVAGAAMGAAALGAHGDAEAAAKKHQVNKPDYT